MNEQIINFNMEDDGTEYTKGLKVNNCCTDGDGLTGKPELEILINEEKTFDTLRIIIGADEEERYIHYISIPKLNNGILNNIHVDNNFYNPLYDFIATSVKYINNYECNKHIKTFNLQKLIDYINESEYIETIVHNQINNADYKKLEVIKIGM